MITVCTECGRLYEAGSEEQANEPDRVCRACSGAGPRPAVAGGQGRSAESLVGITGRELACVIAVFGAMIVAAGMWL